MEDQKLNLLRMDFYFVECLEDGIYLVLKKLRKENACGDFGWAGIKCNKGKPMSFVFGT